MCDGEHGLDDLVRATGLSEAEGSSVVMITLEQLRAKGLLVESSLDDAGAEFRGLSRRAMMKKAALVGVSVPIVSFLVAPMAASAASTCIGTGQPCANSSDTSCCPGNVCINIESGPTGFACFGCISQNQPCTVGGTACCGGLVCAPVEGAPVCVPIF
jgi:hypothetical protein